MDQAMPWLALGEKSTETHQAYAELSIDELLAGQPDLIQHQEINTLMSGILLNLPGGFEWHPLPPQAQWAPATGTATADFNLDGHLDLFISQNWDTSTTQWAPLTSGRGLLLAGDGTGRWSPVQFPQSGINLSGQQGSPGVTDFNLDEKPDLLVYDTTLGIRLFQNQSTFPKNTEEESAQKENE